MNLINSAIHSVKAFAPATCANVAIGFDILGFAFEGIGDYVTLTRRTDEQIIIESIASNEKIPSNADKNTASVVLKKISQDLKLRVGFSIQIQKGIPLSSGMGGSAASAVAALVAFNAFLKEPLPKEELARYALLGEELASGQPHADNIVPCLWGGLTLIQALQPMAVISLPIPEIYCALVHPHLHVPTKQARNILKEQLPLQDYVKQSANLAAFVAALYTHDLPLFKKTLVDILIEPQRAQFVPGFYQLKAAALEAGALGISFSGSGPSLFAFAKNKEEAKMIVNAIQEQLKNHQVVSDYWISQISKQPAHVQLL